ncbi:MAG: hypothetical protein JO213_14895 [Alphaproteobacteria bacterium]|nr:hypothetical protein [Alphaproteobacteria bacterium]MBV9586161.1 hypothetical protein [Alphaproteobacteria bacterium]
MSALAAVRGRLALALPGDPLRPLLACVIGLIGYLAAMGGVTLVLLGAEIRERNVSLADTLTLEIPASTSAARTEMSLALLRQTKGIRSVRLLDISETARLLEPWLGGAAATDTLPVPRLVDVKTEPDAAIDVVALRERLSSIAPGAQLDDHRPSLAAAREAALRAAALIALGLAALVAVGGIASLLMTRMRLVLHRGTVELFHVIGAADADIARPAQAEALGYGLLGGAIGAAAGLVTVIAIGAALQPAAWRAAGFADWRLWGVAIAATLGAGLAAAAGARSAVLRQLARMP